MFLIEELVKSAKEGNKDAMESIIEKFKFFIIKQANKYKIPSYDFEDLIQYGNLSVIKAIKYYKIGNKKFTGYCLSSIINNYNALLKSQIKFRREVQNEELLMLQINDYRIEEDFIRSENRRKIVHALNLLKEPEKGIIKGVYFKDKTLKQTALEVNINYRKATQIKKSALIKLKKTLN